MTDYSMKIRNALASAVSPAQAIKLFGDNVFVWFVCSGILLQSDGVARVDSGSLRDFHSANLCICSDYVLNAASSKILHSFAFSSRLCYAMSESVVPFWTR